MTKSARTLISESSLAIHQAKILKALKENAMGFVSLF